MKSRILAGCTLILLLLVGLSGQPQAAPWYQPEGLSAGDTYQLAFVTSTTTYAISDDVTYYFNFVNDAAALNSDLAQFNFRPIISTDSFGARGIAYVWGEVYNLNGELVASTLEDMWDGSINAPINIDQFGNIYNSFVFTGTDPYGYPHQWPITGAVVSVGYSISVATNWLYSGAFYPNDALPIYALSDPIAAVPLPAAIWLMGSGMIVLGVVRRKPK